MTEVFPFVSVIMPVRNEGDYLEKSLGAVLTQSYPAGCMEVLVADGMSTDNTRAVILKFQKQHSNLSLIDNPRKIVAPGLNLAIQKARGEIIVRVDGHTIVEKDYVSECVKKLNANAADNVGGRMTAHGVGDFAQAVVLATSSPFGVGGARFHYSKKEEYVDTVYLGAWKRSVFAALGGFDEEMVRNQDDEFNYRMLEHNMKILLCPDIRSSYFVRSSLTKLVKQYFEYGYWKVRVMKKHPRQIRGRHFAPPAFAAAVVLSGAAAALNAESFLFSLLLAVYFSIAFSIAAFLSFKRSKRLFFILPLVFFSLHSSYGLGFWCGLFGSIFKK